MDATEQYVLPLFWTVQRLVSHPMFVDVGELFLVAVSVDGVAVLPPVVRAAAETSGRYDGLVVAEPVDARAERVADLLRRTARRPDDGRGGGTVMAIHLPAERPVEGEVQDVHLSDVRTGRVRTGTGNPVGR